MIVLRLAAYCNPPCRQCTLCGRQQSLCRWRCLYDTLDTAMGARADPLMIIISTQAATDVAPMSQLVDYGRRVVQGIVDDPSFSLHEFSAPIDADPWSEETWILANPALGDFLSLEEVRRQASQARRMPAKEPAFRNLILNQRVSAERHFLTATEWMACDDPVNLDAMKGRRCFAGLDLSQVRDLTSLVLVFPVTGRFMPPFADFSVV